MTENAPAVRVFRVIVAALAVFYFFEPLFSADERFFFRAKFLTLWGLYGSTAVAVLMLARSFSWIEQRFDGFVSMVIVLNVLVVFLYWRLYFQDPALVNGDTILPWWREYYLHLLCQILMWIDAFFIFGAWRKIWAGLAWLAGIIAAYVLLIEFYIKPRNSEPVGDVTNGLPYPFLNNMEVVERLGFYGTTAVTGFVFALVTLGLAKLIGRRGA
ncbi:MAG: hypothetical protein AAGJ34_10935 [Pseudomonadota bacterium]